MSCQPWLAVALALCLARIARAEPVLPVGSAPEPLAAHHFPDRLHTFIWRNWETADVERMAEVLGTSAENVPEIAESMGLPPHAAVTDLQRQRGYISVIRRNWHLLNYDQLLTLLGWDAGRLAYTLKEDDFLWHKLGRLKPNCKPLRYSPPTEAAKERCAEIKAVVESQFRGELTEPMQPRFAFVGELSAPSAATEASPSADPEPIRFLYSYFAVYGDPLLDPTLDPYPDGLLQRLAGLGVNGVWLHTVLRQLAPSADFPEFGQGHETRLANLRRLVNRAGKYGINVYLYMNEPRSMPAAFFEKHEDIAGARQDDNIAMCTSTPMVRRFLTDALAHVFSQVPDLGGVFTITASENLTNCFSRGGQAQCPRCSKRKAAEVIAEVNKAIAEGVRRGNPGARVIVWDWGWHDGWAEDIIRHLPDDVYLMSVSEWSKPIVRGGVASTVGEYSMSAVGPGPRARRHWEWARQRGLKTLAKVQVNCTWELSAVPYLPVMNLVGRHLDNLTRTGIDGAMLSWTLGGYPSPNLQLVHQFSRQPPPTVDDALTRVAESRFGPSAAPDALKAWGEFSKAFSEFPFHITYLYAGPSQLGPANLLQPEPTGYRATMVGFPYDDVDGWRAVYPADVLAGQFEKVADGWKAGLARLRNALDKTATPAQRADAADDLRIAEATHIHFKSVANQVRFIVARNALAAGEPSNSDRSRHLAVMKAAAQEEIGLAARLFTLTRQDARIGYEASNHYYYYPLDLIEKVINCRHVLAGLERGGPEP